MSSLKTTVGGYFRMTWDVDKLNARFFFECCPPIPSIREAEISLRLTTFRYPAG